MMRSVASALLLLFVPQLAWSSSGQGTGPRQVAIIGAGAGGSSAAYYLSKFASESDVSLNITIFEKEARAGGRTLTVNVYDDPLEPVELGASIFIELNHILYNATQRFNLPIKDPESREGGLLGIWDGDNFVFTMDETSSSWWNLAKLFWKYGTAPYRCQKLMQETIGKFLNMYTPPYFPFQSLTKVAFDLGLASAVSVTGEQFLQANKVSALYSHDIVQASTRVNYAANIAYIHGLDSMVAMAPEGAMQVAGGNWQIFQKMIQESIAHEVFSTVVTSLSRDAKATSQPAYVIKTKAQPSTESEAPKDRGEAYPVIFDKVIVAAPLQFSQINVETGMFRDIIDEVPYVKLCVTLFTSPLLLSPEFFNLSKDSKVPTIVLTTLAKDDSPAPFPEGAGKAMFYSISTLRRVINPKTQQEEFLYKIFSPYPVTAGFLSKIFGADIPDDVVGSDDGFEAISWFYPHTFNSYPIAYPRVTFQDPMVGTGLYYTSGMDSFISTMETNALMGMNVAKLLVDEIAAEAIQEYTSNRGDGISDNGAQDVLGEMGGEL